MADDVKIEIGGDTSGAKASMKDLEQATKMSFEKMAAEAEETGKDVSKAFKSAGIRTEKAINESSKKARRDFEKIRDSGVASANEIKRAHNSMTAKIKRNNREMSAGAGIFSKALKGVKANLFAITAAAVGLAFTFKKAFDFAESGAKLKAQQLAFKNFTTNLGADSEELLKKLTEVSRGTVSQAALIKSAGVALLLGLDPTKITQLMEVARAASKITGEELTTQFEDIAKGTGRASKLILDNLGIMFSQGEATRRAAESAGVLVSELTDVQIKVGNLTEVIRQGQAIIQGVGKDYDSQADALARLKTSYTNIKDAVSIFILKGIFPLERGLLRVRKAWLLMQRDIFSALPLLAKASDFFGLTSSASDAITDSTKTLNEEIALLEKRIERVGRIEKGRITTTKIMTKEVEKQVITSKQQKEIESKLLKEQKKQIADNLRVALDSIDKKKRAQQLLNASIRTAIQATKSELRDLMRDLEMAQSFLSTIQQEIQSGQREGAQRGFNPVEKLISDLEFAEKDFKSAIEERKKGNIESARELTLSAVKAATGIIAADPIKLQEAGFSTTGLSEALAVAAKMQDAAVRFAQEMEIAAQEKIPAVAEKLGLIEGQLEAGKNTLEIMRLSIKVAKNDARELKAILSKDTTSTHTQIINTVNTGGSALDIPGFSDGVKLPGYGGGDKILARLEAGERVISKEASRRLESLGGSAMSALHKGDVEGMVKGLRLPGFRDGGKVVSSGSFDVNLKVGDNTFAMSASKKTGENFMKQIKSMTIIHGKKSKPY